MRPRARRRAGRPAGRTGFRILLEERARRRGVAARRGPSMAFAAFTLARTVAVSLLLFFLSSAAPPAARARARRRRRTHFDAAAGGGTHVRQAHRARVCSRLNLCSLCDPRLRNFMARFDRRGSLHFAQYTLGAWRTHLLANPVPYADGSKRAPAPREKWCEPFAWRGHVCVEAHGATAVFI